MKSESQTITATRTSFGTCMSITPGREHEEAGQPRGQHPARKNVMMFRLIPKIHGDERSGPRQHDFEERAELLRIHGDISQRQRATEELRHERSVCSWIEVSVCRKLTVVPMISAVSTMGAATIKPVVRHNLMIS
jgi:hypothetical protein